MDALLQGGWVLVLLAHLGRGVEKQGRWISVWAADVEMATEAGTARPLGEDPGTFSSHKRGVFSRPGTTRLLGIQMQGRADLVGKENDTSDPASAGHTVLCQAGRDSFRCPQTLTWPRSARQLADLGSSVCPRNMQ